MRRSEKAEKGAENSSRAPTTRTPATKNGINPVSSGPGFAAQGIKPAASARYPPIAATVALRRTHCLVAHHISEMLMSSRDFGDWRL